jgi:ADP-L-glycero-D-manno-heptose 6-epimerase
MIVVTGAAGFIGSCMVGKLNNKGFKDIILVDDFSRAEKQPNIARKIFLDKIDRRDFFLWLDAHAGEVDFVFHIGARTDTTEFDMAVFDALNLNYSKKVWHACTTHQIPLIFASSAATYGDGSLGYSDMDDSLSNKLQPLNPYGISKNEFDKWVLQQTVVPPRWYGMKFFNVFGPNEYHKGRMASVVFHAFNQVDGGTGGLADRWTGGQVDGRTGVVKLFRSHRDDYEDGGQLRDFIYVKDVIDVLFFLMQNPAESGIYNLGTGKARTFLDLANAVFAALNLPPSIEFIDTPVDIRDKYQYFTEAGMEKLRKAGYNKPFYTLESAIAEYVQGYLAEHVCF